MEVSPSRKAVLNNDIALPKKADYNPTQLREEKRYNVLSNSSARVLLSCLVLSAIACFCLCVLTVGAVVLAQLFPPGVVQH
jgi:hypothetical protein